MVVGAGPGVELVEQLLVPQASQEAHPPVGQGVDPLGVGGGVGGRADHHQGQARVGAGVALHHHVHVVLHLEAGHEQVVPVGTQVQLAQAPRAGRHQGRAVGDELGGGPEDPVVVLGDPLGVGDEGVRAAHRQGLREPVVAPPGRAPLAAPPLQAVHVGGHRDARRPQHGQVGGVGRVEDHGHVRVGAPHQVLHAQPRVGQGLQAPTPQRRELDEAHTQVVGGQRGGRVGVAAVDQDTVAHVDQAPADLLDGGLETTVVGWHAARTDHCDAEGLEMLDINHMSNRHWTSAGPQDNV